ncbi:hypothetical protein BHE74_00032870 [Ensete ventricosum]|nr:hypothetical protein GW17_00042546 [Ensete ventricosum]RWW60154.1 hypothetical protein BHE74_00032870 [Ensete ventricosum]RZS13702.1 hypothetical protein BHM03_00045367 [Ensete ventricosum]
MELQPDNESRSSLGIRLGSDDALGPRQEFARRFNKWIRKLAGNTLGDRRKKTGRLVVRMSEAVELTGVQAGIRKVEGTTFSEILTGKSPASDISTSATQDFGWLSAVEPHMLDS